MSRVNVTRIYESGKEVVIKVNDIEHKYLGQKVEILDEGLPTERIVVTKTYEREE